MKDRRKILASLPLTLVPVSWTKPIVEHVTLPAHAATTQGCGTPGCYVAVTRGALGISDPITFYFQWPGGFGENVLPINSSGSGECGNFNSVNFSLIFAESEAQALQFAGSANVVENLGINSGPDCAGSFFRGYVVNL